jgi:hypothetical protein
MMCSGQRPVGTERKEEGGRCGLKLGMVRLEARDGGRSGLLPWRRQRRRGSDRREAAAAAARVGGGA